MDELDRAYAPSALGPFNRATNSDGPEVGS
jgi:hypothetical protein